MAIRYTYDAANRLVEANGTFYTWDANGNLLNDGALTYAYDSANRLTSVSDQSSGSSYAYNGLGDRVSQTVNGVTTTYTLDLNAGLTQVLADGMNVYLYGNGRIAQHALATDYFLTDALGSVRQLADSTGTVTLAKSYQPYGNVMSSAGSGASAYGYTGEQQNGGLVYLRARYLSTSTGRFLNRDSWSGDNQRPMSYNKWLYAYASPTRYTDPSGFVPCSMLPREDCGPDPVPDLDLDVMASLMFPDKLGCKEPYPILTIESFATRFADLGDSSKIVKIIKKYVEVGRLVGPTALIQHGRLKDKWLVAVIVGAEFGKAKEHRDFFYESLEALSFQYHKSAKDHPGYINGCGGTCNTIRKQIAWLYDLEPFYNDSMSASSFVKAIRERQLLAVAQLAIATQYRYGSSGNSRTWGLFKPNTALDKYVREWKKARESTTGICAPWWHNGEACDQLNKGAPFEAAYLEATGPYAGGMVFRYDQNVACTNYQDEDGSNCKGW